jgi:hypothetical protein
MDLKQRGAINWTSGAVLLLCVMLLASGCTFNAGYSSAYLPATEEKERMPGEVLIYMPTEDRDWVYSGHPTSFTGGASTLSISLGGITQQIAVRVFAQYFSTVQAVDTLADKSGYVVAVQPRVQRFEYAYNQLKNLGFAITPEVWVDLHVRAQDPAGKVILDKVYASGKVEGESYAMTGSPGEKTNAALHQALWRLMSEAATDIRSALR